MMRGLHRKAYVLEIGLSLLLALAVVGCGGGGGGGAMDPSQNNNPVPAITTLYSDCRHGGGSESGPPDNRWDELSQQFDDDITTRWRTRRRL